MQSIHILQFGTFFNSNQRECNPTLAKKTQTFLLTSRLLCMAYKYNHFVNFCFQAGLINLIFFFLKSTSERKKFE